MNNKNNSDLNRAKKHAILNELEAVKSVFSEDNSDKKNNSELSSKKDIHTSSSHAASQGSSQEKSPGHSESSSSIEENMRKAEFQFPLLDPGESTIDGSDFSDTTQLSLKVTEGEIEDQAQLIIQDLINESMNDIEERMNNLIPGLKEQLKKRLDQAMAAYIDETLHPKSDS